MREKIVTSNVSDKIANYKKSRNTMLLLMLASFVLIIIGLSANLILVFIGIVAAIWSGVAFAKSEGNLNTYEHGHEGEEMLRQRLHSFLPDDYIAYFGYPLNNGQDIDCVLLGPSGLYVIETKHHNGSIQYTDGGWRQVKTGRGGTAYHGNLKNPGGQVFFALRELKTYLENKGIKIFIKGVVIFTNPSAMLSIEKDPKPLMVCKIHEIEDLFKSEKEKMIPQKKIEMIEKELNSAISATLN